MSSTFPAGNLSRFEQSTGSAFTNSSFWNSTQVMAVPEGCVVLQFSEFLPWDNPDNLISLEVEQMFDMIVAVVFLNILFLISAPTNILNMMVFTKQGLKERINLCLFFQSLADLLYMTGNFLLYADRVYIEITHSARRGPMFQIMLNNHLAGFFGFNWASGFMTMVIASERCFCVLSPLRSQQILQTRSMLVIILLTFLVIVGGFFLIGTRWSVACVFDPATNFTSPEILPSKFYLLHKTLIDSLDGYVYGIILPGIYILVISVTTAITVVKLQEMASWREKTSSAPVSVRDVTLTRMLIGCSLLFIACNIPAVVFRVFILFVPDVSLSGRYYNTFTFMVSVTELCCYVNSSFNFFVFYSLGTKYKHTLKSLFVGKRTQKQSSKSMDELS